MQMRAGLITIVVGTLLNWCLSGLYHMVIAKDMMMEAYKPFESVMRTEAEMGGMAGAMLWMIPLFILCWFLLRILTQVSGPIATGRGATWGVIFSLVFCVTHEFSMCMWFKYSNLGMSALNCGWDALSWGITGAVMALIYSKLYKA